MQVWAAVSESPKAHNEDAFGFRDDCIWVIDGATPLGEIKVVDGQPAAAWLSNASNDFLATAAWHGRSLTKVLADLVEHLRSLGRTHGIGSSDAFPTGAISLVRQRDRELDLCLLGDCQVVLRDAHGRITVFTDPQFVGVEERLLSRIHREITSGTASADVYARVYGRLRDQRRRRNTDGGAWVLGNVAGAAEHAYTATVAPGSAAEILVMSDGFARALQPFGLVADPAGLVDAVARGEAATLVRALRAVEAADPDCERFPRFGASDDATVVYARL
jgi:hypothetical protein